MINKIKTLLLSMGAVFVLATPALVPAMARAVDPQQGVCRGASTLQIPPGTDNSPGTGNCTETGNGGTDKVNHLIAQIINIFSVVVGVVAVIMIIVGGFRYITSGGDSGKVGSAKNTILYALIGLVIVALAQIIVRFVLNKAV